MSVIMITYDLHRPDEDGYSDLYDYLRKFKHRHPVESVWFVDTQKTPVKIRDEIEKILPYPDKDVIIVIKAKNAWATFKSPSLAKWFKEDERTWNE